jgi:hypothetical protein
MQTLRWPGGRRCNANFATNWGLRCELGNRTSEGSEVLSKSQKNSANGLSCGAHCFLGYCNNAAEKMTTLWSRHELS